MRTYQSDRAWADRYNPDLTQIIRSQAHRIITVRLATPADDHACVADMEITVEGGKILCRVRDTQERDLTIRSWRSSGAATEAKKIIEGAGKWYLYAWVKAFDTAIAEWMFVDLDIVRSAQLIEKASEIPNKDKSTRFKYISRTTLNETGAIIAEQREPLPGVAGQDNAMEAYVRNLMSHQEWELAYIAVGDIRSAARKRQLYNEIRSNLRGI